MVQTYLINLKVLNKSIIDWGNRRPNFDEKLVTKDIGTSEKYSQEVG